MAAWIESHQTLKDHPKTLELCGHLGAERPQVVGHLHLLWWWCIDYALDGNLTKYSKSQIALAAEWEGDPDEFFEAMKASGFLDISKNEIKVHDWFNYCGALIERRIKRLESSRNGIAVRHLGAVRPPLGAVRPPLGAVRPPTQPNPTQPDRGKGSKSLKLKKDQGQGKSTPPVLEGVLT